MSHRMFAVLVLALIGLSASLHLSVLHYQVHNQPGHHSFCAVSERVNCDTVAVSPYSVFLGLPVATWGILYFALFLALVMWGYLKHAGERPWGLVAVVNAPAVGASIFLLLVSKLAIFSLCIMCIAMWVSTLGTGLLAALSLRRSGVGLSAAITPLGVGASGGGVAFVLGFFALSLEHPQALAAVALLAASTLAVALLAGVSGLSGLLQVAAHDVRTLLGRRRRVMIPLMTVAILMPVAAWVFVPQLYPELPETIAGGVEEIAHGVTPDGRHWIGAEHAKVTVFEYSDYACPFCRKAHQILREVVREQRTWLRLVHIHMPLDHTCNPLLGEPFHRHACACARASICAARQEKFWQMNDRLFLRRCGLDAGGLALVAEQLGLDVPRFRSCMKSPQTELALLLDLKEGARVAQEGARMGHGLTSPVFELNGQLVVGVKDHAWWLAALEPFAPKAGGRSEASPR